MFKIQKLTNILYNSQQCTLSSTANQQTCVHFCNLHANGRS